MVNKDMPILLVEDNPADAYLVQTYLNEASVRHELFHADSLFEGLATLKEREVQMVLLDLSLPDSQGFRTLTTLLERAPSVPVIVLTGLNNEIVGNQAVKAGAQDYLVKGQFDGKLLGRSIRYAQQRFKEQLRKEEILQTLAASEKRYAEAQSMGQFGNWQMDIVTNEMIWTDEVFRIFGFQSGSMQPSLSSYLAYVYPEDRDSAENFFTQALKNGAQNHFEHRLLLDGTTVRYVSVTAKVNLENFTMVGIVQDITDRKVTEKLLLEKSMTQKSNRVKEEVLDDMGFQIRTPLSSIINFLHLIEGNIGSLPPGAGTTLREPLDGLRASVDDLNIIINNLLNLSVLASETLKISEETFHLRDFFPSLKKLVQIKSDNAGVRVAVHSERALPEKGVADVKKFTQVLHNILSNAIRLSPKGSEVNVETEFVETEPKTIKLQIKVHDCAPHFSMEKIGDLLNHENLLKTYTENSAAGDEKMHEIGVTIASKLASALGGTLQITNKDGASGNVYAFEMPLRIIKTMRLGPGEAPNSPLRILLVEDHYLNQIATRKVLLAWSEYITVDLAENGMIGVEKFREYGYDLILMDLQMPVLNGIDAAKRIREQSTIPIIALTANASRPEMDKCFEVGMNDYISKPFKPQELYSKILALIGVEA